MKILVTGAKGFVGKNLVVALKRRPDTEVFECDVDSPGGNLGLYLVSADVIYHLAGVNRPERVEEFEEGNAALTRRICETLTRLGRKPVIVMSSSTQAELANPYGTSKRKAEEAVLAFGLVSGADVYVYRLPGVFGKWCRPNYNSVVATFCHNIAHDLSISISDPEHEINLVYIDDVVASFVNILDGNVPVKEDDFYQVDPVYRTKLGALAEAIQGFRDSRTNLHLPDMDSRFIRCLYATYTSYLPTDSFAYPLKQNVDPRGELAELLKSPHIGQIFVSRTRPGITRGHHYHDTKVEKFVVLDGDAIIRFRHILGDEVIEYPVSGSEFRVVDIPAGYTHSIENIGDTDLIVLFWANEVFDPHVPDVYPLTVG